MESNNWKTTQTQSDQLPNNNVEAVDWRLNFSSESRRRVFNRIVDNLKKHYPDPSEASALNNMALKFEKKTYSVATSQVDYLKIISAKLCAIDNKIQNTEAASLATIPSSSSQNALDTVPQNMQVQRNSQGQAILVTSAVKKSEARQQIIAPDLPVNIASAGIQSSAGLASTLPSVSATNESSISNLINQSSNMQKMAVASQNALVNSMGNVVASNIFNNQKEVLGKHQVIPGNQHKNQQQPQQIMSQNWPQKSIMQNSGPNQTHEAGNSKSNDVLQQHLQSMLRQQKQSPQQTLIQQHQQVAHQSTRSSQPQQQMQTSQLVQSLMGQQTNTTNMLEVRQQQQRLTTQQMGHQGNTSGIPQQMQGTRSSNSVMNPNQPQINLMPQNKGHVQLQNQQIELLMNQGLDSQSPQLHIMSQMQSETNQLPQHVGMNQKQCDAQQRLQPSGISVQSHHIDDQQKQNYQSQRVLPAVSSASTDSISQTGHPSSANWQEEVHTKITSLKDRYFTNFQNMYRKMSYKLQQVVSLPQQSNNDQIGKLNAYRTRLKEILTFLLVNKSEVTPAHREKLPIIEKHIVSVLNLLRSRRPDHGPPPMQSIQQAQSHENRSNTLVHSSNIEGPGMMEQNNRSLQQNSVSPPSGSSYALVNMSDNLKPKPNVDAAQGSGLASLKQGVDGSLQQTSLNAFSVQNGINLVQPNISSLQPTNSVNQQQVQEQQAMLGQQLRHQIQQPCQQMLQKQQQQHQKSMDHQQVGLLSAHQVPQLQKMEKVNEVNIRQGFGAKIGTFSQHHGTAVGQPSVYHPQLKSGASFPISSSQMLQTLSPQNFQTSSPGVDQQNILVSVSKAGTPLRSANSLFTTPSRSTTLAPSPMQGDSEKIVSKVSALTTGGNVMVQQSAISNAGTPVQAIETSGTSASPLVAELSNQEISHGNTSTAVTKSSITEEPLERLIKVVKSISNEALTESVKDMGSILSMLDRIAGSAPGNGSTAGVGEDLAAMTNCRLQAENLASQEKSSERRKMKRRTSFMPSVVLQTDGSSQLTGSESSDWESTATSRAKRPRTEVNYSLLREISDINQWLIDTVVNISEEYVNPSTTAKDASEGDQGVIVKCSYNALALSPCLKSRYATQQLSPIQPLRLLVPSNYPKSSPVLLDTLPANISNENEDLSIKAKSKLSRSLCTLSQPISLKEIAKTWDFCTRAVISEYAQANGGGSFSSRYGSWESVF